MTFKTLLLLTLLFTISISFSQKNIEITIQVNGIPTLVTLDNSHKKRSTVPIDYL